MCCLLCFFNVRTDSPSVTNKSGKKFGGEDPKVCENSSDADGQGPDDNRKSVKSSAKVSLLPKLSESVVQVTRPPCEDENAMFPDAPLSSSPAKESADVKTAGGVVVRRHESRTDAAHHRLVTDEQSDDTFGSVVSGTVERLGGDSWYVVQACCQVALMFDIHLK